MKSIRWIFKQIAKECPPPLEFGPRSKEMRTYLRKIRRHIFDALEAAGANVKLVALDAPRETWLPSRNVLLSDRFYMQRGNFVPNDDRIKSWHRWSGAQMRISTNVAIDAVNRALSELSSNPRQKGRPRKQDAVAKAYFEKYPDRHEAVGESWEGARKQMEKDTKMLVSLSTLKRSVKNYNIGQKSGQK